MRNKLGSRFGLAVGVVLVLSSVAIASCSKTNTTTTVAPTTSGSQISGETSSTLSGSTTSVTEPTTTTSGNTTTTAPTNTTTVASGAAAQYAKLCAGCHSSHPGAGLTATQAAGVIRNGKGGMPSFTGQLTSAQISSLGAYVAKPGASTTTTTAATTAAALYAQKCSGCHSSHPGAGLTATQAAGIIASGTTTGMPSFASQLTSVQMSNLGAYVTTSGSTTTTTTEGTHPAWKALTNDIFATELNKVGISVVGSGPTGTYTKAGVTISYDDLLDYLPADQFYKDAQGYHYVQEEGAINPTTGLPAGVTKPPTTTTTTTTTTTSTTTSTTTTTSPSTTTTGGGTTTTGATTTTTVGIDAAALYTQYCSCHQSGVPAGLTAIQIANTIGNGTTGMPGFSSAMSVAQITALAAYAAGGGH